MNIYKISFLLVMVLILSGCENLMPTDGKHKEDNNLNILNIEFEPEHKYFHTDVKLNDSIAALLLRNDTTIKFHVEEYMQNRLSDPRTVPELVNIQNIKVQEIANLDLNILALADLTLDSVKIESQKRAIKGLKELFSLNNLHIAFIKNKSVSETMTATDYVLDNYFKADHGQKYLYRSILSKIDELKGHASTYFPEVRQDTISRHLTPKQDVLIIFSDGKVYDKDMPLDPDHFALQRSIAQNSDSITQFPIFYINLETRSDKQGEESEIISNTDEEAETLMQVLCQKTNGKYLNSYDQNTILNDILNLFDKQYANYRFSFVNPDLKIFRGLERTLQLSCYQGDSLIASDFIKYNLGSIYNPIIINGLTTFQVILQGSLLGLLTLLLLYMIFQFITPSIHYLIFKRKHVTRYTGKNMSYNGILVEPDCYYCKAPFEAGDEIVVKCQHVLHKSCWDENEYKCPEYGRNCKTGSHYYNRKNLFDRRNSSFYLAWILAGALAGLIAWICFTANAHSNEKSVLINIIHLIFEVDPNSPQASVLMDEYGSHLYFLPFYGLNIGFFLTFFLSLLTGHGRWLWKRSLLVVAKAIVGGLFGYLSFLIGCIISITLNFKDNSFLIDWIPWMLSGFVITLAVAYGTDIKLKKALVGAVISIIFGLGSMYLWSFAFNSQIDTREFLLLSYMIYCIGFAISVAATCPKSERYFLRVEGPIKEMDIALYKWMNATIRNKRVTIGKSVNCDLQMSWDLNSPIAPQQAEIRMINGNIYLIATEEGVRTTDQKPIKPNVRKRLYHGSKFRIGKTIFTYIEKDL